MSNSLVKAAFAVLSSAIILFLACSDYSTLNFPSQAEVNQRYSGLSSSGGVVCDDESKCAGRCYDQATQFCYNDISIHNKCNGGFYNPESSICCSNELKNASEYGCCNNENSYLLAGYICKNNKVLTKCGEEDLYYDPQIQFCTENKQVLTLCGGNSYEPPEQKCIDNVITGTCGGQPINSQTHFCFGGTPYPKCESKSYDLTIKFCSGNKIYDRCGNNDYDPTKKFCSGTTLHDLCGGNKYNTESEFCSGNSVYPLCEVNEYGEYDPSVFFCQISDGKLYSCGGKAYNPATQFCHTDDTIKDKCGGTVAWTPGTEECCGSDKYTVSTHFCLSGNIYRFCGTTYDPLTQYCHTDNELYSCGNKPLNPDKQFCYGNSTVINFCNTRNEIYDPSKYECKTGSYGIFLKGGITDTRDNNKKYNAVLIGTQIWMAENLNYKTPDGKSRCHQGNCDCTSCPKDENYNECLGKCKKNCIASYPSGDADNANCGIYGRLYSWETVNTGNICPSGWHLPSNAEWFSSSPPMGTNLKANSDLWNNWNDCSNMRGSGNDIYGFAALPGGGYYRNETFGSIGDVAFWWSSTVCTSSNSGYVYRTDIYTCSTNGAGLPSYCYSAGNSDAALLSSVRCVKDN